MENKEIKLISNYRFKCWDSVSELRYAFGLDEKEYPDRDTFEEDNSAEEELKKFICENACMNKWGPQTKEAKKITKMCRKCAKRFAKVSNELDTKPLFKSLSEIKDDEVFIKYFLILLRDMWT
jgi:hypothetical protein